MRFSNAPVSRRTFAGLIIAAAIPATPALAAPRVLRGTVSYRERMLLPPSAVIEVKLLDISLADAPARTIAETRVSGRRIPAPWTLRFDSRQIDPRHSYALQARILDRGRLLFITTERHSVFTGGPDNTDIWVQRVAGQDQPAAPAASPIGSWRLASLGGAETPASITTVITIAEDGRVSGRGGCNGFGGNATIQGRVIRFSQMVSTMMACAPDVMKQEQRFLKTLERVHRWSVQRNTGRLALLDRGGRQLMTLTAQ